ncbi:MAG TPA: hypothetical protein VMZ74_15050 [Ramlibacter sp.]|nr:hypothetical protein [Ramlibacter sp.]
MRIWLALLASPSLALAAQSIMFSLVTPSCTQQTRIWLHVVAAATLAASLLFTWLAREAGAPVQFAADDDAADPPMTRHFLAVCATAVGAISSLVILCMWMVAWVLSPCYS